MDEGTKNILIEIFVIIIGIIVCWSNYRMLINWRKNKREVEREKISNRINETRDEAGLLKKQTPFSLEVVTNQSQADIHKKINQSHIQQSRDPLVVMKYPGWGLIFILGVLLISPTVIFISYLSGELPLNNVKNVKIIISGLILIVFFPGALPSLQMGNLYFYSDRLEVKPAIWRYRRVYPYETMHVIYKNGKWSIYCCEKEPNWRQNPIAWYKFFAFERLEFLVSKIVWKNPEDEKKALDIVRQSAFRFVED